MPTDDGEGGENALEKILENNLWYVWKALSYIMARIQKSLVQKHEAQATFTWKHDFYTVHSEGKSYWEEITL